MGRDLVTLHRPGDIPQQPDGELKDVDSKDSFTLQ